MTNTEKNKILRRLNDDEEYYGEYGRQYLSNSDIKALLENPLDFKQPSPDNPNLIKGSYFHTLVLEPNKLERFKIIDSATRNTNKYKELSGGEICLLEKEADELAELRDKLEWWKLKADIVNKTQSYVIDLKTTSDIDKFAYSAKVYNYDSQAYIYSTYFKMDFVFIVICKKSKKIGIFDCSPQFLESGKDKVQRAVEQYRLFYKDENFDATQYFISKTL
jgi:hypothetical protein